MKLNYTAEGAPTWVLGAGGLPAAASGAAGSAASLAAQWHRLTLSTDAKQEPFFTKELDGVRFDFGAGGRQVAVVEGGAATPTPLVCAVGILGPYNGTGGGLGRVELHAAFCTAIAFPPHGSPLIPSRPVVRGN